MSICSRYRVYLENEDDEVHSEMETDNFSAGDYLDEDDLLDVEEKENLLPVSDRTLSDNTSKTEVPVIITL